jgi:hypothetical protein
VSGCDVVSGGTISVEKEAGEEEKEVLTVPTDVF